MPYLRFLLLRCLHDIKSRNDEWKISKYEIIIPIYAFLWKQNEKPGGILGIRSIVFAGCFFYNKTTTGKVMQLVSNHQITLFRIHTDPGRWPASGLFFAVRTGGLLCSCGTNTTVTGLILKGAVTGYDWTQTGRLSSFSRFVKA